MTVAGVGFIFLGSTGIVPVRLGRSWAHRPKTGPAQRWCYPYPRKCCRPPSQRTQAKPIEIIIGLQSPSLSSREVEVRPTRGLPQRMPTTPHPHRHPAARLPAHHLAPEQLLLQIPTRSACHDCIHCDWNIVATPHAKAKIGFIRGIPGCALRTGRFRWLARTLTPGGKDAGVQAAAQWPRFRSKSAATAPENSVETRRRTLSLAL